LIYRVNDKDYYDYLAMMEITGMNKSSLHRVITDKKMKAIKYKNKHLFNEVELLKAMEAILLKKIRGISSKEDLMKN
jgi:hypothetical protein